jgi:hypothetical protein
MNWARNAESDDATSLPTMTRGSDALFLLRFQGTFGLLCRSRDSNPDALAGTGFEDGKERTTARRFVKLLPCLVTSLF